MFYSINKAKNGYVLGAGYNEEYVFLTWQEVLTHLANNPLADEKQESTNEGVSS